MYSGENTESDSGPVFVREKGQLRNVNELHRGGDIQYKRSKRCGLFDRSFSVKLCLDNVSDARPSSTSRKEHFVFTYTKEGSLRYSAKSLFGMCLLFIADNVQYVDSLLGFPEQLAERLFTAAEEKQKFSHGETGPKALQLFTEAYGDLVLKSLCLRNRFLLVSEKLEEIQLFCSLRTLDLFGCKLGDSHEILSHLTSEAMSSLTQLCLGDNCLSNRGLRRLTAPVRVMCRGLGNLQLLDLSCKIILCIYPVDFSSKSNLFMSDFHSILHDTMGFVFSETPMLDFCHSRCKTQGWAEQVVKQWEICMSRLSKPKKDVQSRTDALHFCKKKFLQEKPEVFPLDGKDGNKTKERIQFYKPTPSSKTQTFVDTKHLVIPEGYNKKRSLYSLQETCGGSGHPVKCQSALLFTVEDRDLLNSY
ncbi:leucine-rich repeat-containing protein 42 isoform X2 [Arapaima gigas]